MGLPKGFCGSKFSGSSAACSAVLSCRYNLTHRLAALTSEAMSAYSAAYGQASGRVCPACGNVLMGDSIFCRICGTQWQQQQQVVSYAAPQQVVSYAAPQQQVVYAAPQQVQTVEVPRVEIRQEIEQRRNVQTQEVIKEVVRQNVQVQDVYNEVHTIQQLEKDASFNSICTGHSPCFHGFLPPP